MPVSVPVPYSAVMTKLKALLVSLLMTLGVLVAVQTPALAAACSSPCYYYAGIRQTVDFDGIGMLISKENPAVDAKAYHSLAELSVYDSTGNNVIEVGWTKDPLVCAAGVSICLFAFNWVNGVPGCYNACGAVNGVGCAPYCLGASLDGIANGTTKNFAIQHINGAWWMAFDGAWRFAIPDTDWGANAFSVGKKYQVFGEVAASDTTTCTDMANGVMPTAPPTALGGKFNSVALVNGSAAVSPTAFATDSARWNALMVTGISARWGGTGGC
jgi:hypothetical protein